MLSRVLDGGWLLLIVAAAATVLGVVVGALAGVTAAYYRGWRDGLIMRIVDIILAFPAIVFALLLVSIAGPKLWLVVVAVAATHAPQVARVMRSVRPGHLREGLRQGRRAHPHAVAARSSAARSCPTWSRRSWSRPACA